MTRGANFKVTTEEFVLIFKKGLVFRKPLITISKKVAQKAVDRNRIKRIISEALRQLKLQKAEVQIIVRKNIKDAKTYQIQKKLEPYINKFR